MCLDQEGDEIMKIKCDYCGKKFETKVANARENYCSQKCRDRAYYE